MEDKRQETISNERFYMDPYSITTLLFEKELKRKRIKFIKNDMSIQQPYIVYSFFENDIDFVHEILDKAQKEEFKKRDLARKKTKSKRKTFEYRQKRMAAWILVFIIIAVILLLLLS